MNSHRRSVRVTAEGERKDHVNTAFMSCCDFVCVVWLLVLLLLLFGWLLACLLACFLSVRFFVCFWLFVLSQVFEMQTNGHHMQLFPLTHANTDDSNDNVAVRSYVSYDLK